MGVCKESNDSPCFLIEPLNIKVPVDTKFESRTVRPCIAVRTVEDNQNKDTESQIKELSIVLIGKPNMKRLQVLAQHQIKLISHECKISVNKIRSHQDQWSFSQVSETATLKQDSKYFHQTDYAFCELHGKAKNIFLIRIFRCMIISNEYSTQGSIDEVGVKLFIGRNLSKDEIVHIKPLFDKCNDIVGGQLLVGSQHYRFYDLCDSPTM